MSTKFGLPSELEKLESELGQQVPQSSGLNRDELMYRAGWAAAEVARKFRWGWPTTSGVLAASVAVLIFLLIRNNTPLQVAELDVEKNEPDIEVVAPELVEKQTQPVRTVPARFQQSVFSDLAKRHHLKSWDAPVETPVLATTEVKSVRSLMQEFLIGNERGVPSSLEKSSSQGQLF